MVHKDLYARSNVSLNASVVADVRLEHVYE